MVFIDTAGRLHIDEALMGELQSIKAETSPTEILLTVDSMIGQDAVNVAEKFNEMLDITGVILTKLDGDTRGAVCQIRYRKADKVYRRRRKDRCDRAVLPRPYGKPYTRHGRCAHAYR